MDGVRGYVSVVIACPYSGPVDYAPVRDVAKALVDMGATRRVSEIPSEWSVPVENLAGHFHDTYGTAVSNVLTALEHGIRTIDASIGGLGGCPYSPGATGNVATEDVLYALQGSKYHVAGTKDGTIDLEQMADTYWVVDQRAAGAGEHESCWASDTCAAAA
ncbi:hypothetical protein R3P38DRAFT_3223042 [Favolaschia claudopus]|uniref:hydroxymethylglutaryl-CoA lyase n=1 Tax=Favolaschia claudopus TaxID=2862362 RepID=A0AAV9ZYZ1_9AGAR